MSKSQWLEKQKGNFSNEKKDTFDPGKRYVGIRLQQGVPLLDRDWNELEDIRRYGEMELKRWYIGSGTPDNGFAVSPTDPPTLDFKIGAGRCMVDGFDVVNQPVNNADHILYSQQEDAADLGNLAAGKEHTVYIDAWIREVTSAGDEDLENSQDIDIETSVRHQLIWRVRVVAGETYNKEPFHHYYNIAKVTISPERKITGVKDLRVTGLTLASIKAGAAAGPAQPPSSGEDLTLSGALGFSKQARQMINLWESAYGVGIQAHTQYFRTAKNFAWYKGGAHNNAELNPGGGTPLMVIKNVNVGIGTQNPSGKLSVYNGEFVLQIDDNKKSQGILYQNSGGNYTWRIYRAHAEGGKADLRFAGGPAVESHSSLPDRLTINKAGNVGIGTTEPTAKLHVAGNVKIGEWEILSSGTALEFKTAGKTPVKFDPTGIAIPTLSGGQPAASNENLALSGTLGFSKTSRQMINLWDTEYGVGIQANTQYFRTHKNFAWYKGGRHNDGELNPGGGMPLMVIKDGLVGIGTQTPSGKLSVYNGEFVLQIDDNKKSQGVLYQNSGGNYTWRIYRANAEGGKADLRFAGGPAEKSHSLLPDRLTINNAGNVGIGTTAPTAKLHVAGNVKIGEWEILSSGTALEFKTAGKTPVKFDPNGIVGLEGGVSPPAVSKDLTKLHLVHKYQDPNGNTLILGPTNASNLRIGYHSRYSWIQSHGNKPLAINAIGNNVGIGTAAPRAKLDVAGFTHSQGIAVNNGANSGVGRGVWLWMPSDSNHVIYSANPTGKSPANKTAPAGFFDRNHRLRLRTAGGHGFLFENNGEQALVDIDASQGRLWTKGAVYAGNSDIYFTNPNHNHTTIGNQAGLAAIENAKNYDALMILGRAGTAQGRKVRLWDFLQVEGNLHTTGTSYAARRSGAGIDYAEYFKSKAKVNLKPGTSVVLEEGYVRAAKKGETPMGVISSEPLVVGNLPMEWSGKHLRDEWGKTIMEEYKEEIMAPKKEKVKQERQKIEKKTVKEEITKTEVVLEKGKYCQKEIKETVSNEIEEPVFQEVDLYDAAGKNIIGKHQVPVMETYEEEINVIDEHGNPVMVGSGEFETKTRPKLNPDYEESKEYTPRDQRPDWHCVGLLGQLRLRKGQPTAANWIKIKDMSDKVEMWLVK